MMAYFSLELVTLSAPDHCALFCFSCKSKLQIYVTFGHFVCQQTSVLPPLPHSESWLNLFSSTPGFPVSQQLPSAWPPLGFLFFCRTASQWKERTWSMTSRGFSWPWRWWAFFPPHAGSEWHTPAFFPVIFPHPLQIYLCERKVLLHYKQFLQPENVGILKAGVQKTHKLESA